MKKKRIDKTQRAIADRFGVTTRTVRAWERQGAPTGTMSDLKIWLAAHRVHVTDLEPDRRAPSEKENPAVEYTRGAASALERLETAETQAFGALQRALEADDPLRIRACREAWLKISDSLRRYDLVIEQARRSSGAMVPKEAALELIRRLVSAMRVGITIMSNGLSSDLVRYREPAEMHVALTKELSTVYWASTCLALGSNGMDLGLVQAAKDVLTDEHSQAIEAIGGLENSKYWELFAECLGPILQWNREGVPDEKA